MESTGARQTDSIAILLRSTAPDCEQLEHARTILGCKILSEDEILDLKAPSLPLRNEWNPLGDRVLKWLLSKLSKQEALPATIFTNPSTYSLLLFLVLSSPETVVLRRLQYVDLPEILCKCLMYTRHELELLKTAQIEPLNKETLKRKQPSNENASVDSDRKQSLARVVSICRVFDALYQRTRYVSNSRAHVETIRSILKMSVERAGLVIEAGLSCILDGINHEIWGLGAPIDTRLVRPLLSIWQSVRVPEKSEDGLYSARIFAKHCLIPSLVLQNKKPDLFLDNFIKRYCLQPFMQSIDSSVETSNIISAILIQFDSPQKSSEGHSNDHLMATENHSAPQTIPLLIKLIGQVYADEFTIKKRASTNWFQQLFVHLAGHVQVDFHTLEPKSFSTWQSEFMANILAAYQDIGHDPGNEILSKVVLRCPTQDRKSFSTHPWRIIKLCLDLRPDIVIHSETTPRGEAVRRHVLSQIDSVDQEISVAATKAEMDESALSYLLEPLLDALVKRRSLLVFIPDWEAGIERALSACMVIENQDAIKKQRMTFWEHYSVKSAIANRISKSIARKDLYALITTMLEELPKISQNRCDSSRFYTQMTMWPTIRSSYFAACGDIDGVSTEDRSANKAWMLPLYRIVTRYYLENMEHEPNHLILELLRDLQFSMRTEPAETALEANRHLFAALSLSIKEALTNQMSTGAYECASAAWSLLRQWILYMAYPFVEDLLQPMLESLWHVIDAQLKQLWTTWIRDRSTSHSCAIQTFGKNRFELRSSSDLVYSCVLDATMWPCLFDTLDRSHIQSLVDNLYLCAFLSPPSMKGPSQRIQVGVYGDDSVSNLTWRTLWSTFVSSDSVAEVPLLCRAVHRTRILNFVDSGSALLSSYASEGPLKQQFHEYMLNELSQINVKSIPKNDRGKMINQITAYLDQGSLGTAEISSSLRLLHRLMKSPTKSASLVADCRVIWQLGSCLRSNASADDIENLRSVTSSAVKYWTADHAASNSTLNSFITILAEKIGQAGLQSMVVSDAAIVTSGLIILSMSEHHKSSLPQSAQINFLECQLRQLCRLNDDGPQSDTHMFTLLNNITSLPDSMFQGFNWLQSLNSLHGKSSPANVRKTSVYLYLHKLDLRLYERMLDTIFEGSSDDMAAWCWSRSKRMLALMYADEEQSDQFDGQELFYLSYEAGQKRVRELRQHFRELSSIGKARLLVMMAKSRNLELPQLIYLQGLVSSTFFLDEREAVLIAALRKVIEFSLGEIEQCCELLISQLRIVQAIHAHNSWAITQEHIDRTLVLVTSLTSQSCTLPDRSFYDTSRTHLLISGFIKLLNIIFQNHRPKIGARWHLVVDALKGILRCLFVPYNNLTSKDTIAQPRWIFDQDHADIDEMLVSALSRLLSSICDPTHKALKSTSISHHGRQVLNDASKAARAISGQHMQHFIGEFCSLQLKGKMVHADALKPGLYAIFDAMNQDVRKSLNESLDVQARVMFKSLYDEWVRFGKWTGN